MSQPGSTRYDNAHLAWLCCLYSIARKIRREGLMSIEADIEMPASEHSLFQRFPQTLEAPYLNFAIDILRLMVGGNLDAADMEVYARHYQEGLHEGSVFSTRPDASLLRTIWLTLWASLKGYAPPVAAEFGRQALPARIKPGFTELENHLKATHSQHAMTRSGLAAEDTAAALEAFFASLTGK